jgi:hypothetical protein
MMYRQLKQLYKKPATETHLKFKFLYQPDRACYRHYPTSSPSQTMITFVKPIGVVRLTNSNF